MLKAPIASNRNYAPAPRKSRLTGMVAGQCVGLAVSVLMGASIPTLIALVLAGSVIGALAKTSQKQKSTVVPFKDKRIRAHVFRALEITTQKLNEIIHIDEEFNGAASGGGGEKDRFAMKATPKLAVPPPAPPKMGGM